MATTGTTEAPLRGSSGQLFDLEPPRANKRSRFPELAVGLLLIVGGALGALIWQINATRTTPVLAAARQIEQGAVVELDDLQLVEIRSADQLNVLGSNETAIVVGRVARTDLAPGTLLTPEHVTEGSVIELGDGVVGMALSAGEVPSLRLRPGEAVNVVLTPPSTSDDPFADIGGALATIDDRVLVEQAVVVEFAPLDSGDLFVALTMSDDAAALTARAASLGRVRLVAVGEEAGS